jgi:protein-S-isoprenylcysteine O-methyltransferase Ste14
MRATLGKIAYGALFSLVLPALLILWARATAPIVHFPAPRSVPLGAAVAGAGVLLVFWGWWALRVYAGGLPMNAFPPPRLATRGPYALLPHPIYVGFCVACAGVAIAEGSASGFYLVTPVVILACVALVLGYEGPALRARFGGAGPEPWLRLAPDDDAGPAPSERLAAYALAVLPWALLYEIVLGLGRPADAFSLALPFEARIPVREEAEALYFSIYPAVLAAPLLARTRRALRRFETRALLAMALVFPIYLALPVLAEPRPFLAHGPLGVLLAEERAFDTPMEAFPSFHVLWALIVASTLGTSWAWGWAALVALACVLTGMHTIADVAGGAVAFALVARAPAVWAAARGASERIANSWTEWRIGRLRLINHGLYAGIGSVGALVIVSALVGPGHVTAVAVAGLSGMVVSALWAQIVEGSSQLMRPYGFYGGVLGIVLACIAAPLFGTPTWPLLAAFCVSGPFVQSMGRLRCLVQGCCHGAPTSPLVGIAYRHPRSRVVRIAHLAGTPLHPTPVYSIAWNVVIALAMTRLWWVSAPTHFIAGFYLVLTGLGRFVEEGYRGEPQTPTYGGLRLYQWIAVGTVVAGAAITALGQSDPAGPPSLDLRSLVASIVVGTLCGCALGVDFPESNKRFSRLA